MKLPLTVTNMYKVQTQVDFEAAHRLYDVATYSEECRNNVHGHSYKVTFIVGCEKLNEAGMVIDFKLLKKIIRENIEAEYDHSCILKANDPLVECTRQNCKKVIVVNENPTAEWMSKFFFDVVNSAFAVEGIDCRVIECRVQETEHNIAIYDEENACYANQ